MRSLLAVLSLSAVSLSVFGQAQGPSPYLSFADSPFSGGSFDYFHLENFEDSLLSTPGVSVNGSATPSGPGVLVDSVDGDDGVIDGSGTGGIALYSLGNTSFEFTFDPTVLGDYPTHAGIVFTDIGLNNVTLGVDSLIFEAFDPLGVSLGQIGPTLVGDGDVRGTTAEDRFFGWISAGGISRISLSSQAPTDDWEVDHLQYGRAATGVPDGGGLSVSFAAAIAALFIAKRKLSTVDLG
jgi:hypothetical protein